MQKISIKREQSQAGLSFAEREKFRPQVKNKLLLLLALLLTAATGAWATDYTTLAVGDVIKVGDTFSPTADGAINNNGVNSGETYTLIRADIDNDFNVDEKTDGAYYVFKYVSIMSSPYIHFDKAFEVKAISDGLEVTNIKTVKGYLFYTLALHESAAAAAGYTVSMKDGVKDADKWTISPNPAAEGSPVTIQYTGRLKVKGVTATSEAAAPSVPEGAISGVFSVSDGKQVYFSKGNLQATYNGSNWSWAFAEHQWDYIGNAAGNTKVTDSSPYISENATVDLFGWVGAACAWTGAAQYGISNVKTANQYGYVEGEALKSDWGTLAITNGGNTANFGWRTLTSGDDSGEWDYLFKTRTTPSGVRYAHATVNSVPGLVLLPDDWSTDYYSLNKVNDANGTAYTDNVISSSDWTSKLEAHGAVFLPAGGYRGGTDGATVSDAGNRGNYWSSTSSTSEQSARYFFFGSAVFWGNTSNSTRNRGCSVRLVYDAN